MTDDLHLLEEWVAAFARKLSPRQNMVLRRRISQDLRKLQIRNIRAQRGADGRKWPKRKQTRNVAPPIRYFYRGRGGSHRELEMSSYRDDGDRIVGYDKEAKGVRTMLKSGMVRKEAAKHPANMTSLRKRAQMMLVRMASPKHLGARGTQNGAEVGFFGRAERIARVHHFGERDSVRPGGPQYDYPARPLLGIGRMEREAVLAAVLNYLNTA
ncbi:MULTISPECIES: phage virion morphogenesis protein [Delftia]|nr:MULTISPECIES: phage virion morphogenesis protein [Delftia]